MIPAAAVMLFHAAAAAKAAGRHVSLAVSYVQIYNEVCDDLLVDKAKVGSGTSTSSPPKAGMPGGLKMRWSKDLGFFLEGVGPGRYCPPRHPTHVEPSLSCMASTQFWWGGQTVI